MICHVTLFILRYSNSHFTFQSMYTAYPIFYHSPDLNPSASTCTGVESRPFGKKMSASIAEIAFWPPAPALSNVGISFYLSLTNYQIYCHLHNPSFNIFKFFPQMSATVASRQWMERAQIYAHCYLRASHFCHHSQPWTIGWSRPPSLFFASTTIYLCFCATNCQSTENEKTVVDDLSVGWLAPVFSGTSGWPDDGCSLKLLLPLCVCGVVASVPSFSTHTRSPHLPHWWSQVLFPGWSLTQAGAPGCTVLWTLLFLC